MVTDEALSAVGTLCVLLESLSLYSFQRFSDKLGLEAVAAGCSELTRLEVNGCHNITTYGLESIGRACM
ncbi:putative leucine-rich repeat domain superfamily [Helianthus debilis subsp. tardiflorus]